MAPSHQTIPETTIADIRENLPGRLSEHRLAHSLSVADFARHLAEVYGVDAQSAYVAGLLHDWDKDVDKNTLKDRARELGIGPEEHLDDMVGILHAAVGAQSVHERYPELSDDIINAIRRHTVADLHMSDLDMVIYVADMLEPTRTGGRGDDLRGLVGKISLFELYRRCYKASLIYLIGRGRYIYPKAMDIYNELFS